LEIFILASNSWLRVSTSILPSNPTDTELNINILHTIVPFSKIFNFVILNSTLSGISVTMIDAFKYWLSIPTVTNTNKSIKLGISITDISALRCCNEESHSILADKSEKPNIEIVIDAGRTS